VDTEPVNCVVCLFTVQFSLILIVPTHRGMTYPPTDDYPSQYQYKPGLMLSNYVDQDQCIIISTLSYQQVFIIH